MWTTSRTLVSCLVLALSCVALPVRGAPAPTAPDVAAERAWLPSPLRPADVAKQFPAGDLALAKELNKKAFAARTAGRSGEALAGYRAAVAAAPAYALARFNLACELALAGQREEALATLADLYRQGTPEALRVLLRAEADADLAALHGDPRLAALLDAAGERRPVGFDDVFRPGCHGWSPDGDVAVCTAHCDTAEWGTSYHLGFFASKAVDEHFLGTGPKPDAEEEDEVRAQRAAAGKALETRRIPLRRVPRWPLRKGAPVTLGETGFVAEWTATGDVQRVVVRRPSRRATVEIGEEAALRCGQAVMIDGPDAITAYVLPSRGRILLFAEYSGRCCDEEAEKGPPNEHWSAVYVVPD